MIVILQLNLVIFGHDATELRRAGIVRTPRTEGPAHVCIVDRIRLKIIRHLAKVHLNHLVKQG